MRLAWLITLLAGGIPVGEASANDFFEKHVRPVLVERCTGCHGAKQQKAGLRLDSRAALLKGSDDGPVIVPGDAKQSLLVDVIRYEGAVKMPPEKAGGKLGPDAIDALATWVAMGAPWPAEVVLPSDQKSRSEDWRRHWSFRPIADPPVPATRNGAWPQTPIDSFILAQLEEKGIDPNPPADRRTLIRRATYDLTGLPPTPAEVDAFLADGAPDAFARVVDRLLASPRHGERWARHWLDVARYADTKGYVLYEEPFFPYSYSYRDWVVKAINEDLPYDQFILRQLAADEMHDGESGSSLAALGFLTLGRRFLNNIHDIVDDRIDVVGRGLLGLTVSCARCHDHKFDPFPTRDYYSLYGVFANAVEEDVAVGPPTDPDHEREYLAREKAYNDHVREQWAGVYQRMLARLPDYLLRAQSTIGHPATTDFLIQEDKRDLSVKITGRWRTLIERSRKSFHPVFGPWNALAEAPVRRDPAAHVNPVVEAALAKAGPRSLPEMAKVYGQLFSEADRRWRALVDAGGQETRLPDAAWEEIRRILYLDVLPQRTPTDAEEFLLFIDPREQYQKLRKSLQQWANRPGATPRAHILRDSPVIAPPRVFLRGSPGSPGPEVPLQAPAIFPGPRAPFVHGGGRLELGRAIASIDNPLTARVAVNRIWLHHFGAGLCRTPSDFGLRGEPPSHPELLDWLARRFARDGWSSKRLHRLIMLSAAYQQSSADNPAARDVDPEDRLLWRVPRQRLDLESMRDSLLFVGGRLDPTMYGRSVPLATGPFSKRRTLYGHVDREQLAGLYRAFDFASPDTHVPQRVSTTGPQQTLFLLHSPFVVEEVRALLARPEVSPATQPARRVRDLFRLVYGRGPSTADIAEAERFVRGKAVGLRELAAKVASSSSWSYGHGALDACQGRLAALVPLSVWSGSGWRAGKVEGPYLDSEGGRPGEGTGDAVVRRWTAPRAGVVEIRGTLKATGGDKANPVRGHILVGRRGRKGDFKVLPGKETETVLHELSVAAGETIDFVVDSPTGSASDTFQWAPVIKMHDEAAEWDARAEFRGPPPRPVDRWEEYARALLLSNEFMFVD